VKKAKQTPKSTEASIVRSSAAEYLTFVAASGQGGVEAVYADSENYDTQHYSLPAIIAVGYKVNADRAVQFRKWATGIIDLDVAEDMAQRKIPMTMQDWETRLNRFIEATERDVLQDAGKVSAEIAKAHAESEFEKYRIVQDRLFESDFDRLLKSFASGASGTQSARGIRP